MTTNDGPKILMRSSAARRLANSMNRRRFLAASGGTAMAAWLAACGSDAPTTTPGEGTSASGATDAPPGDVSRKMNMFTWAEYDDPRPHGELG